jgi:hypothetical protein
MFVEQRLQKVHSNEQIIASTESAGNGIAQCSQAFLISNILSSTSVMRSTMTASRSACSTRHSILSIRAIALWLLRYPPAETRVFAGSAARVPASKYDQLM